MYKSDIAEHVANRAASSKPLANEAAGVGFDAIQVAPAAGNTVTLIGFGTFSTRRRAARTGRRPQTGQSIAIGASSSPSFRAGKTLRDAVRQR